MTPNGQPSVINRLAEFLPTARPAAVSDLRRLYAADPELLFELVRGVGSDASIALRGLEFVAREVLVLLRDGFQIATRAGRHIAEGSQGGLVVLDDPSADQRFLEDLYVGSSELKSLPGQRASIANVDFYLKAFEWESQVRNMRLLRLDHHDVGVVRSEATPPYQVYELLDCAREVVRTPYAVWHGVRETGILKRGTAYCGVPSRSWRNDGTSAAARQGFVYLVFADPEGRVYDWDWVVADKTDPLLPEEHASRFESRVEGATMAELVVDAYSPSSKFAPQPLYSRVGDCVFYYFKDSEAYAKRLNPYRTAYFDFATGKSVGFKLKFVSRLVDTVHQWGRTKEEGISISFDPDTIRVKLSFLMQAWLQQNLPFREELEPAMELMDLLQQLRKVGEPEVVLPKELVGTVS